MRTPDAQFYLSSTWIFQWMSIALTKRFVLAARCGPVGSNYVAFFPLRFRTRMKKGGGFYTVVDMACQGIADYTGFICRPEYDDVVIPAFANAIRQFKWKEFNLDFLRASDSRARLLLQCFPGKSYRIKNEREAPSPGVTDHSICPYVDLPDSWETYLATRMSANSRQKARRLLKKIEESDSLTIRHADKATFERDIDIVLQLWDTKWSTRRRRNLGAIVHIVREMLKYCFEQGALFLPMLWEDDKPICGLALLVDHRKKSYLFIMTGRDETYEGPAPGFALHAHAIRHAIENGFRTYDFLQGNDRYKYSFGVEEQTVLSKVVSPKAQHPGLDESCLATALARTRALHKQGKLAEAERGYRQIVRMDPQRSGALYGLGNLLRQKATMPKPKNT